MIIAGLRIFHIVVIKSLWFEERYVFIHALWHIIVLSKTGLLYVINKPQIGVVIVQFTDTK